MERYYAIRSNYEFSEYDNKTKAMNSEDWLFILICYFDDKRSKLIAKDFNFINKEDSLQNILIKYKGWSASIDSVEGYWPNNSFIADFRFIAPDGRIKYFKTRNNKGIENIIQSMKKLVELSKFDNWEQYDVVLENERLKSENETLKNQLKELQNKLTGV